MDFPNLEPPNKKRRTFPASSSVEGISPSEPIFGGACPVDENARAPSQSALTAASRMDELSFVENQGDKIKGRALLGIASVDTVKTKDNLKMTPIVGFDWYLTEFYSFCILSGQR